MLTGSTLARVSSAVGLLALAFLEGGCGGKQIGTSPDAGASSEGGVIVEPDGAVCVDVVLSSYDQSCDQDSDCISITTGVLCSECLCGGSPVNKSGEARYQAQVDPLISRAGGLTCGCPAGAVPQCLDHTCTVCGPGSTEPACGGGDGGTIVSDASADGPGCVDIMASSYDQSCKTASDCIIITAGDVCSGACACGGATINKSSQAAYEAALDGITPAGCPCPASGQPECIGGTCTICGPGSESQPGCPDGG
jgi:hypothetical protein